MITQETPRIVQGVVSPIRARAPSETTYEDGLSAQERAPPQGHPKRLRSNSTSCFCACFFVAGSFTYKNGACCVLGENVRGEPRLRTYIHQVVRVNDSKFWLHSTKIGNNTEHLAR
jgi:hypothetical protein